MAISRRETLAVGAVTVAVFLAGIGGLALSVQTDASARADPGGLGDLHDAGVTGENVSVGVVDVTGFDPDRSTYGDQVVAARAFGPDATVANGGRNEHGTAAATVVAETAPDADLYLAAFESAAGYERAVQWLLGRDVDVVVAPVSFYGKPGDGSARVSQVATDAVRQDVVFVAPAGNLARSHWQGRYDDVENDSLAFDDGTRTYLRGEGGHVTTWLSWEDDHAAESYTAELYRTDGTDAELVARSRPFIRDVSRNERLDADVGSGLYYLRIRGPPEPTGARLRLSSPTHAFQRVSPQGSLGAPATARGVLTVGAYDTNASRIEPFSSRGPTADGRRGVDVVAPARHDVGGGSTRFTGTSAAAPYVGGVVALLLDAAPGQSPLAVEHRLEGSAADVGPAGPDVVAGHGLVVPRRAVSEPANASG